MYLVEDSKYIYLKSLQSLKENFELLKQSKWGANSNIYIYNKNEVLKVYNKRASIFKQLELEHLKKVDTTNIVKPNKFLFLNEDFYGFSMDYIKGSMFAYLHHSVNLDDFLKSLLPLESDLRKLSEFGFLNNDLNILNVIYNKNEKQSYIIDVNSFCWYNDQSKEVLTVANLMYLYTLTLNVLSKINNFQTIDNKFFLEIRNKIYNNTDFSVSIVEYFKNFISLLENYIDNEVSTIGDFRRGLKLIK